MSQEKFIGGWHLMSWEIAYSDNDRLSQPFGANPQGLIMYTPDGYMNAVIARADRALFPTEQSIKSLSPEALAEAYASHFQYAGRYRIEGQTVIHSVQMSLNPNFVGSEQIRGFKFEDDRLTLSGEDQVGAQMRMHRLCWPRA
jgi:hypothetical protein